MLKQYGQEHLLAGWDELNIEERGNLLRDTRYGIEMGYNSEDVFASIKKRDEDANVETPSTAKKLQSEHWKRKVESGIPDIKIPESKDVPIWFIKNHGDIRDIVNQIKKDNPQKILETGI